MSPSDGWIRVAGYEPVGDPLPGRILSLASYRGDVIVICELPDGSPSSPYISWDGSWRKLLGDDHGPH